MRETLNNFKKYPDFKVLYFLACAWLGSFQPFISIYLHHFSTIKPSVIGLITCLIPFLSFVAAPLWTGLADKHNFQKGTMMINCVITFIALLLLIPTGSNLAGIFLLIGLYSVTSAPIYPILDSYVLKKLGDDSKLYGMQRLFGAISYGAVAFVTGIFIEHYTINLLFILYTVWMVIFLVYFIFTQTSLFSKSFDKITNQTNEDSIELETQGQGEAMLKDEITVSGEEEERLEDSNSSTPTSPILSADGETEGIIISPGGEDSDLDPDVSPGEEKAEERLETRVVLKNLFKDVNMMIFLFAVTICGMTANIIGNFLFLYLQDVKHASSFLLGSTMPFTVVMELPFFFFGKQLIEKIGIVRMICMGHLAFIIRLALYNILDIDSVSPWFVLPIEILHGVAFATIWGAGIELSFNMAPKGYETTYQGIFTSCYCGLGAGLGSIIGGFLYEHKSPMFLFRFTAIATAVSLVVFALNQLLKRKQ